MRSQFNLIRRVVWFGLAIYLALFTFNSVTRIGRFSPDSMNYVNVARNIAQGQGITQPTLGFNQPQISPNDSIPAPLIAQPPIYPLMIALISRLGIFPPRSALAISALATGFIFILTYKLAAAFYDENTGLLATGLLLFYGPLRYMAGFAWSEPLGICFVLFSLLLLTKESGPRTPYFVFAAGLFAGLSFATRYALFPLSAIGVLFLLISSLPRIRIKNACVYACGFGIPAGFVWAHNLLVRGSIMPPSHRAPADFFETVYTALRSIFGRYVFGPSAALQFCLFAISLVVCGGLLVRSGIKQCARELLVANKRYLLVLWSFGYLIFIIAQRSAWFFGDDRANEMLRIITPAGVVLLICWSGLLTKTLKLPRFATMILTLLLLFMSILREARALRETPPLDFQQPIFSSQRLSWLASSTSNQDLIIGNETVDIPFFLPGRSTISFSPYPITHFASYELIMLYSAKHCTAYRNTFIVLSSQHMSEDQWKTTYGDFFANLVFGHIEQYRGIALVQQLEDASVFKIDCR